MARRRESRQAAKRLTAHSCLQRVTTATRPSITPRSDGLTHAFCQGAEPRRWSLFNLHADTLPLSLSLLAISRVHTHTHAQTLIKSGKLKCARTQTRTLRMPADTVKHKHICMYLPVLKKTRFCNFLQMTLPTHYTPQYYPFYLFSEHMTQKPWKQFVWRVEASLLMGRSFFNTQYFFLMCITWRATGNVEVKTAFFCILKWHYN